jgi:hypothetical protein
MRRGSFIGGLLAAALLAAQAPAMAQSTAPPPRAQPPKVATPPRVTPLPPRVQPPRLVIRPSQAAMIAQRVFMGAKVLGVKPKGGKYAVTLKLKDKVKQVTVDGTTGDVD